MEEDVARIIIIGGLTLWVIWGFMAGLRARPER